MILPASAFPTMPQNASSAVYFLDTYPELMPFWGFRKGKFSYSGYAFEAKRLSDSQVLPIGFIGEDLDVSSLLSFAGSSDVIVNNLYEQNGFNYTLGNPSDTKKPKIVQAGVLVTQNGKPAMLFDGVDDILYFDGTIAFSNGASYLSVHLIGNCTDTGMFNRQFVNVMTTANNGRVAVGSGNVASGKYYALNRRLDSDSPNSVASFGSNTANSVQLSYVVDHVLGNRYLYVNGSTANGFTSTVTTGVISATNPYCIALGANRNTLGQEFSQLQGYIQELALSSNNVAGVIAGINSNQKAYWGTP